MAAPAMTDHVATADGVGVAGVNPQTYTVTLPTYAAGDFVIIHLLINAGDLGQPSTPTGWTLQSGWSISGSGVSVQTGTFTRIMTGSEGTTVTFSRTTFNDYKWKAVASTWANVDGTTPVATASKATSGAGVSAATWTLGTISGAFTSAKTESWGGQYLKLNSDDGTSYSELGVLTVQPDDATVDITTAAVADYDILDTAGAIVGSSPFRLIIARQATTPGQGARIWTRF